MFGFSLAHIIHNCHFCHSLRFFMFHSTIIGRPLSSPLAFAWHKRDACILKQLTNFNFRLDCVSLNVPRLEPAVMEDPSHSHGLVPTKPRDADLEFHPIFWLDLFDRYTFLYIPGRIGHTGSHKSLQRPIGQFDIGCCFVPKYPSTEFQHNQFESRSIAVPQGELKLRHQIIYSKQGVKFLLPPSFFQTPLFNWASLAPRTLMPQFHFYPDWSNPLHNTMPIEQPAMVTLPKDISSTYPALLETESPVMQPTIITFSNSKTFLDPFTSPSSLLLLPDGLRLVDGSNMKQNRSPGYLKFNNTWQNNYTPQELAKLHFQTLHNLNTQKTGYLAPHSQVQPMVLSLATCKYHGPNQC